jgi:hypothetical protein
VLLLPPLESFIVSRGVKRYDFEEKKERKKKKKDSDRTQIKAETNPRGHDFSEKKEPAYFLFPISEPSFERSRNLNIG